MCEQAAEKALSADGGSSKYPFRRTDKMRWKGGNFDAVSRAVPGGGRAGSAVGGDVSVDITVPNPYQPPLQTDYFDNSPRTPMQPRKPRASMAVTRRHHTAAVPSRPGHKAANGATRPRTVQFRPSPNDKQEQRMPFVAFSDANDDAKQPPLAARPVHTPTFKPASRRPTEAPGADDTAGATEQQQHQQQQQQQHQEQEEHVVTLQHIRRQLQRGSAGGGSSSLAFMGAVPLADPPQTGRGTRDDDDGGDASNAVLGQAQRRAVIDGASFTTALAAREASLATTGHVAHPPQQKHNASRPPRSAPARGRRIRTARPATRATQPRRPRKALHAAASKLDAALAKAANHAAGSEAAPADDTAATPRATTAKGEGQVRGAERAATAPVSASRGDTEAPPEPRQRSPTRGREVVAVAHMKGERHPVKFRHAPLPVPAKLLAYQTRSAVVRATLAVAVCCCVVVAVCVVRSHVLVGHLTQIAEVGGLKLEVPIRSRTSVRRVPLHLMDRVAEVEQAHQGATTKRGVTGLAAHQRNERLRRQVEAHRAMSAATQYRGGGDLWSNAGVWDDDVLAVLQDEDDEDVDPYDLLGGLTVNEGLTRAEVRRSRASTRCSNLISSLEVRRVRSAAVGGHGGAARRPTGRRRHSSPYQRSTW